MSSPAEKKQDSNFKHKMRLYNKNYRVLRKHRVLKHYSNGSLRCAGCGISDVRVLTIDHVLNNGNTERKNGCGNGDHFYWWLEQNNYPEGYQVLCMNCQFIKKHSKNGSLDKNSSNLRTDKNFKYPAEVREYFKQRQRTYRMKNKQKTNAELYFLKNKADIPIQNIIKWSG